MDESLYLMHRFPPQNSRSGRPMQANFIIMAKHYTQFFFVDLSPIALSLVCEVCVDFDKFDIPLTNSKLNHMVVCRYSSVISSHYLGGQDILMICRAMRGPKKCRRKVLPMGHSGHFTNYSNRIFRNS